MLRSGKTLRQYLVKFRNYPPADARWMQESQLKDSIDILNEYNFCMSWSSNKTMIFAILHFQGVISCFISCLMYIILERESTMEA